MTIRSKTTWRYLLHLSAQDTQISRWVFDRRLNLEKTTKELINALSSGPVRQYILDHEHHDIREIILKNKEIFGVPTARLLEQISTRRKAKDKLPVYYEKGGIIYPPPEYFEQSSSQITAQFKSQIVKDLVGNKDTSVADLTGGFGVDTYFLSKQVTKVHYVEPEKFLLEIARHNHRLLGAENIEYHPTTAEDFLASNRESFQVVYMDPSRRTEARKKIHAFEDSRPDVTELASEILGRTTWQLIKASPLLDVQAGIAKLPLVSKVFVVSVNNENKELLFLSEKGFSGTPSVEALNLYKDRPRQTFKFSFPEERKQDVSFSDPLTYLYEPNASILKAGAFKSVAANFNVKKIQTNTHLYTSDELIETFPGRVFLVERFVKPDRSEIKTFFPEGKANVTTRNYPLTPEALKKKTGLKDGGDKFLIGFSGMKKRFLVVATRLS